ncbi:hypothetical protein [Actinomadura sp. BRA 177]|uniref:hypothetical protein n=1 Tax=Actinomadura sp. BRA 177 TaxID=2745202 RepID=UPI001596206E|nr:hypothetical protein [Actinomadura sp. BRA 177]NVI86956.1 hypothetical protein [Actinomadura sp. BRA 177]
MDGDRSGPRKFSRAPADADRGRWDRAAIAEGTERLDAVLRQGEAGPYQVQAAIAGCHATARPAGEADWPQIAASWPAAWTKFAPQGDGPVAGVPEWPSSGGPILRARAGYPG